jgi:hypothetical protein
MAEIIQNQGANQKFLDEKVLKKVARRKEGRK